MKGILAVLAGFLALQIQANAKTITVLSYNVENLFDTVDDDGKDDVEFTPNGSKKWTKPRLSKKVDHLHRLVADIGEGGPDIMFFTEVEKESVLRLFLNRFNKKYPYIAYFESEDPRGIDVTVVSRYPLELKKAHRVPSPKSFASLDSFFSTTGEDNSFTGYFPTRRILEVDINVDGQILTAIANHWSSRRLGQEESEPKRLSAAKVVKGIVERRMKEDPASQILIAGDFNDEPENDSIRKVLNSSGDEDAVRDQLHSGKTENTKLYNLVDEIVDLEALYKMYSRNPDTFHDRAADELKKRGTYYFDREKSWNGLDQMHVTPGMLDNDGLSYEQGSFKVFRPSYAQNDKGAPLPYSLNTRTGEYTEGYSDHFGIIAKFKLHQ